jgi:hypothetical protein
MARVLEQFSEITGRRDGKYPWSGDNGWANGHVWELEQGSDFDTRISSFRQTCAKLAARRGHPKPPRTQVVERDGKTYLEVQFYPNNTTTPGRRRR